MAQRWLRGMVAHIGRPAMITRRKEGLVNPAGTPFVALASTFVGVLPMDRPLRWGYVPAAQVVGRVRAAGVAAGTRGSDTAQLDRSADRSRPGRRRRRVFHRRSPRSALPEPGTARQPRTVVDRAGCGRRFVRGAGLPIAVVAAALGVRRRAHMSPAGDVLDLCK